MSDILKENFENKQVKEFDIPQIATIEFSGLEKNQLKSDLIGSSLLFLILLIVLTLLSYVFKLDFFNENALYLYTGIVVLFGLISLFTYYAFFKKSYALREKDVIFNKGLFWKSSTIIPFNRVQHCEVNVGPIDKLFGLAELKIFTAGGSASDLSIEGLTPATAQRISDYIIGKASVDEEE